MKLRAFRVSAVALALSQVPAQAEPNAVDTLANKLSYMAPLMLPAPDRLEAVINDTIVKFGLEPNEKSRSVLANILLQQQTSDVPGYDLLVCLQTEKPIEELSFAPEKVLEISAQVCSTAVKAYRGSNKLRTRRDDEDAIASGLLITWTVGTQCSDLFFIKGGVIERNAASKGINLEPLTNTVFAVLFGQSSEGIDPQLLGSLRETASAIKENIRLDHRTFCEQWGKIGLNWGSLGHRSEPAQN
jgi:hypothetical protein